MGMTRDLLERGELLGNIDSFTDEQRKARQTFIEQELRLPREWLLEDGCSGLDASVEGRVATGIYNVLFESDPRFADGDKCPIRASFADVIRTGGDALLWALGIGPTDELEGMLAAQAMAAHHAAMECYRRAMLPEQPFEAWKENLNQANKLSRTYATLLEALNRHRGKGQQKISVEHVHVHAGGQAIVGAVETGSWVASKDQGHVHAKAISDAPVSPLWGEDPTRQPVPLAGDAERQVPEWLLEDGCSGLDASVEGRVATGIYNVLFESDPRFADGDKCPIRASFA
jgi:hypothetical protein